MKHNNLDYNVEKEWEREVHAHEKLDKLDREHLVQAIAAYKHRGQYCILFEWANGGNLRSYWNSTKGAEPTPGTIRDYLEQLRGVTRALNTMHNTERARARSESCSSRNPTSSIGHSPLWSPSDVSTTFQHASVAEASEGPEESIEESESSIPKIEIQGVAHTEDQQPASAAEQKPRLTRSPTRGLENWRHGDIKPANILRFANRLPGLGTLKLADLGRAKQHFEATKNRPEREVDGWRTRPYEPPDLYIYNSEASMSRLFDVWSLGCVFFEAIAQILYGTEWLKQFEDTTKDADRDQTPFWVRDGDSARVTDTVQKCLDQMLHEDPECNEEQQSALRDLLILIQEKMLVIELPQNTDVSEDGRRANTTDILGELDNILEKARDPNYLFTGKNRVNIKALPEPALATPSTRVQSGSSLSVPGASGSPIPTSRRDRTYSGKPDNSWKYEDDNPFAHDVFQANIMAYNGCIFPKNQSLCQPCLALCRNLDVLKNAVPSSRQVQELEATCDLCMMPLARANFARLSKSTSITIRKGIADVAISAVEGPVTHLMRMRICRSPGKQG